MARTKRIWAGHSWTASPAAVVPRIVSAVHAERPRREATRRIVHDLWVLDYSLGNCGRVRVGSVRNPWRPRGPLIAHLYPPGTPYWENTTSVRTAVRELWALFTGGEEAGLGRLVRRPQRFACIADPGGRLDECLRDMAAAGRDLGEAGFWPAQAALARAIALLLGAAVEQDDGTLLLPAEGEAAEPATGVAHEVNDYFRAHLGEKVTLASAARHLGMSESSLSHRYAEETGRPPMAALAALRIELAKSLLLRGLKIETIAAQTGFFDAFHLSKVFKRLCGLSPSDFRRGFSQAEQGDAHGTAD